MAATRETVAVTKSGDRCRIAEGAGHLEGAQVQEIERSAAILDRAHNVGTIEAFTRSGVVAVEVIVQAEWLPILQCGSSVDAPAALQAPRASRKLIGEVPTEAAANIEIRVAALRRNTEAVIGLRCVGDEIFQIAGVVDGMRPDKISLGRQPVPGAGAKTGLQRVVG